MREPRRYISSWLSSVSTRSDRHLTPNPSNQKSWCPHPLVWLSLIPGSSWDPATGVRFPTFTCAVTVPWNDLLQSSLGQLIGSLELSSNVIPLQRRVFIIYLKVGALFLFSHNILIFFQILFYHKFSFTSVGSFSAQLPLD